jgi:Ca2+-binding EF-hand superfamily protein
MKCRLLAMRSCKMLDTVNNDKIERNVVPQLWQNQFDLLDKNADGAISRNALDSFA